MKKLMTHTLKGFCAATLLTACTLDPSLLAGISGSSAFQTLDATAQATLTASAQNGQVGRPGPGGPGGRAQKGQPGGPQDMFANLNLTAEQKTALDALKPEAQPSDASRPGESQMQAFKAKIDAAFLSDIFDAAALESELSANAPNHEAHLQAQAERMIKISQILTAEQKATLKQKQSEWEANMPEMKGPRPDQAAPDGKSPLDHLTQTLKLTDAQQVTLKASFEANKPALPDQAALQAQRKATQTAIDTELANASPSVDKIVALLKAGKPDIAPPNKLSHLAQLHDVLTTEQRQAFVKAGLLAGPGGPGGHGPHDREGFGGHPGMPPQGGGFRP